MGVCNRKRIQCSFTLCATSIPTSSSATRCAKTLLKSNLSGMTTFVTFSLQLTLTATSTSWAFDCDATAGLTLYLDRRWWQGKAASESGPQPRCASPALQDSDRPQPWAQDSCSFCSGTLTPPHKFWNKKSILTTHTSHLKLQKQRSAV